MILVQDTSVEDTNQRSVGTWCRELVVHVFPQCCNANMLSIPFDVVVVVTTTVVVMVVVASRSTLRSVVVALEGVLWNNQLCRLQTISL